MGDIGNGAIHSPDYICDNNGLPPTDVVVADPGEPIAIEGEVCCGGTGLGVAYTSIGFPPLLEGNETEAPEITEEECLALGGVLKASFDECELVDGPSMGSVARQTGGVHICCPSDGENDGGTGNPFPEPDNAERENTTREECLDNGGIVVGDIGDGSIFLRGFICESNGEPPFANIPQIEEPFAVEGEVCCGKEEEVLTNGDGTASISINLATGGSLLAWFLL